MVVTIEMRSISLSITQPLGIIGLLVYGLHLLEFYGIEIPSLVSVSISIRPCLGNALGFLKRVERLSHLGSQPTVDVSL